MLRRHFLFIPVSFLVGFSSAPASSAPVRQGEKNLGRDWRLPRGTVLELWPASLGLDLSAVVAAVADWAIPSTSRLVIRLGDGEHALLAPVVFRSQDGDRLSIVGNLNRPELCRVIWQRPEDAFYAALGRQVGLVDGVTLEHARPKARGIGSAFLADAGGTIRCGAGVRVRGFYYGFQARHGGSILCRGTQSHGAGDANYFAFSGGHIHAEGALAESASDPDKGLGGGFVAEYGGTINAVGTVARYNALAGFIALSNGAIRAYDSVAEMNGRVGYYSNTGGIIVAHRGVARFNCEDGVRRGEGGRDGFEGSQFNQERNSFDARYCSRH